MVNTNQIFQGATFRDESGDTMVIERVTETNVYGCSNEFDFERNSKDEAADQLTKWGYRYIGVE